MKHLILMGLLTLTVGIYSYGQNAESNSMINTPEHWKIFSGNGFSVSYPEDWDLDHSGQMGTSFIVRSKPTAMEDIFQENVNLVVQDLDAKKNSLDAFISQSLKQVKKNMSEADVIENKKINFNGLDAHKVIYTGKTEDDEFKYVRYYWIQNEKVYLLTLTCAVDQFDNYQEIGEQILKSFTTEQ